MEFTTLEKVKESWEPQGISLVLWNGDWLTVEVSTPSGIIVIRSRTDIAHRVMDEGDLLDFWPMCSLDNGWLYEIHSGGWKDLELTREGFLSGDRKDLREIFVVSANTCVNFIALKVPTITYGT